VIASLSQSSWPDFEEYRPLVSACAKRFLRSQSACALSLDDLMQEAWLAMHDASRHLWRIPVDKRTAYMARVIRCSLLKASPGESSARYLR
jgi:DNA-directed RNA polymerase specialized sigma24 family protein